MSKKLFLAEFRLDNPNDSHTDHNQFVFLDHKLTIICNEIDTTKF